MKKIGTYTLSLLILLLSLAVSFRVARAEERPPSMVIGVWLTIDASNWEEGSVSVTQNMMLNPEWLDDWNYNNTDILPPVIDLRRDIPLIKNSLDYEFSMPLFPIDENGNASIVVRSPVTNNVVTINGRICEFDCQEMHVQVIALPVDTFTQALNGKHVERIRYRSTETVEWDLETIRQSIAFTFVPALPLAPWLQTLVENPKVLVGGVVGSILTLISGAIVALSKDYVIAAWKRWRQKPAPQGTNT